MTFELPKHLTHDAPTGLQENEPVAQYEIGNYRNFVYLILDWKTKKASWVDPQEDLEQPLADLKKHGFELASILLTHTHFDHIAGVPKLLKLFPEIPLYVHALDLHRLSNDGQHRAYPISDEESVHVGNLVVEAMHTPGHSAGESTYWLKAGQGYLFTGDTIFIRDCGRTDLESGSTEEMFSTLQRIKKLPGDLVILPGHHYAKECASLLSDELKRSPPFQCTSVKELESLP
jgi:glyoxylase-like metal-dependent hydrolase (beta-lactamase superfamily II)